MYFCQQKVTYGGNNLLELPICQYNPDNDLIKRNLRTIWKREIHLKRSNKSNHLICKDHINLLFLVFSFSITIFHNIDMFTIIPKLYNWLKPYACLVKMSFMFIIDQEMYVFVV